MREKLKALILDDTFFYGALILLIGTASFGLGRLSHSPVLSHTTAPAVVVNQAAVSAVEEGSTIENLTPAAPTALPAEATQGQYVGSKNSDKYHLPWCSGAKRIKEENKVYFASKAEAEAAGYVPAGNCPDI